MNQNLYSVATAELKSNQGGTCSQVVNPNLNNQNAPFFSLFHMKYVSRETIKTGG